MAFAIEVAAVSKCYELEAASHRGTLKEAISGWLSRQRGGAGRRDFWALRDVSFSVVEGEILGLVGRNGAGKSSLLRIISGIAEPSKGHVDVTGRVGTLLELAPGFHPELSGRENIFLGGTILGMRRAEIRGRFDEVVAFSGVERFLDMPVKHYSSGMFLRLAFAVAVHLDAEILLIDEALSVGDVAFQQKCVERLRELARSGRTVVLVSHDLGSLRALCARAVWLEGGAVVRVGEIGSVTQEYAERELAASRLPSARSVRPEPPATLHVGAIELLDAKTNGPRSAFAWGDSITMRLTLQGTADDAFSVRFRVETHRPQRPVIAASAMRSRGQTFPPGTRSVGVSLGPLHLAAGAYTVSVALEYANGDANPMDVWEQAAGFVIELGPDNASIDAGLSYLPPCGFGP